MSRFMVLLVLVVASSMASMTMAFTTTPGPTSKFPVFSPIRVISGAASPAAASFIGSRGSVVLFMSDEQKEAEGAVTKPAAAPGDGTFYDDEVEPAEKIGISTSMRDRLMREASSGLDSEKKQANVILYIIIGVALLVILGGAGIFY